MQNLALWDSTRTFLCVVASGASGFSTSGWRIVFWASSIVFRYLSATSFLLVRPAPSSCFLLASTPDNSAGSTMRSTHRHVLKNILSTRSARYSARHSHGPARRMRWAVLIVCRPQHFTTGDFRRSRVSIGLYNFPRMESMIIYTFTALGMPQALPIFRLLKT